MTIMEEELGELERIPTEFSEKELKVQVDHFRAQAQRIETPLSDRESTKKAVGKMRKKMEEAGKSSSPLSYSEDTLEPEQLLKLKQLKISGYPTEDAKAQQLWEEVWRRACACCEKHEKTEKAHLQCGACHKVCYDSKECQKKHWKTHKVACKAASQRKAKSI